MIQHFGKVPEVPFSEALLSYAKTHKRDHPKHFMEKTRYRLKLLHEWFGDINISDITPALVQNFMDERLDKVSLATVQKDVWFLTRMYARSEVAAGCPDSDRDSGCSSLQSGIRMPDG